MYSLRNKTIMLLFHPIHNKTGKFINFVQVVQRYDVQRVNKTVSMRLLLLLLFIFLVNPSINFKNIGLNITKEEKHLKILQYKIKDN